MRSKSHPERPEPSNKVWLVSEGRTTLQERIQTGTIVIIVKKGVHNTAGTKEGAGENTRWVEQAEVEREGGLGGKAEGEMRGWRESQSTLPVMTRVSISEVSGVPTETAALAELENTHPGKVLFLPPDAEWWIGPAGAHNAFVKRNREEGAWGCRQGLSEKHFHFTPRMH